MSTATAQPLQIAFPKVDAGSAALVIPDAPVTPANEGLAVYAATPATSRKTLSCSALLQGETLERARREATEVYGVIRDSTPALMAYGTDALRDLNDLVDHLLHEVEPVKIPELTALMRELNSEMRDVKRKYDVSDPKVREKYEEWKGGILRFIGKARTLVDLLMEDVTSIERQLDKVGETLKDRQYQLMRNTTYYDQLYEQNEAEVGKLIYVIGVMELIHLMAVDEAAAIQVGDSNLGDRGGEQKAKLLELANLLEIKIAEYKGRLFVAWATAPQVRMMRSLNVGLAERINELICITIPTMKMTIVNWRMLMQTQDAAVMSQVVAEASNEWLVAFSASGAVVVPKIAEVIQQPTLTPQTIVAMVESLSQQADGVLAAIQAGEARRAEIDDAMVQAKTALDAKTQEVSDELIEHVVSAATRQLDIATSVPAALPPASS